MQVAATILRVEPSRTALGVATAAIGRGTATSKTSLAQISVRPQPDPRKPRVVRIDFLRN